jgi:hypothetical protein
MCSVPRCYKQRTKSTGGSEENSCKSATVKRRLWRDIWMCNLVTVIVPVLKSVARKRLAETVID